MSNQVQAWCFTHNINHEATPENDDLFTVPTGHKNFRYCIFQAELAPSGQLHYQGYIELKRSMRRHVVQKLLGGQAHLEPRDGTREQAKVYCQKTDTQFSLPVEFGTWIKESSRVDLVEGRKAILKKRKLDDCYADPELDAITTKYPRWVEKIYNLQPVEYQVDIELRDWQIEIMALLNGPVVHRRIIWIWSNDSNTGKTTFKEYVSTKLDLLPAGGKIADILHAYDKNQVIWFDFTRAERRGFTHYKELEELSNIGYKLSSKYGSQKKFVRAHIVVSSNHPPDETRLPDRFKVYNVDPRDTRGEQPLSPVNNAKKPEQDEPQASPLTDDGIIPTMDLDYE